MRLPGRCCSAAYLSWSICERTGFGILVSTFLSLVHLLLKFASLFIVGKGEASHTLFEFEAVEEHAILIIRKSVVNFLVPDYSPLSLLSNFVSRWIVAQAIRLDPQKYRPA